MLVPGVIGGAHLAGYGLSPAGNPKLAKLARTPSARHCYATPQQRHDSTVAVVA